MEEGPTPRDLGVLPEEHEAEHPEEHSVPQGSNGYPADGGDFSLTEKPLAFRKNKRRGQQGPPPSTAYREVEGPSLNLLRRSMSPPNPILPRRPLTRGMMMNSMNSMFQSGGRSTGPPPSFGGLSKTGVIVGKNGGRYEGELMAGRPHGFGKYMVPSSASTGERLQYEGEWVQGRKEGVGTFFYRNSEVYHGCFLGNERHGNGRMEYLSGDVYEGEWVGGRRRGYGVHYHKGGDVFKGFWMDDRREGLGTLFRISNGNKTEAEWVQNAPVVGEVLPMTPQEVAELFDRDSESRLPRLELSQPNKIMYGEVVGVRRARTAEGKSRARAQSLQGTLNDSQLERLKHAYIALAGGDSFLSSVRTNQLHDLCVVAGLDPAVEHVVKLKEELYTRADMHGKLFFNDFMEVLCLFKKQLLLAGLPATMPTVPHATA